MQFVVDQDGEIGNESDSWGVNHQVKSFGLDGTANPAAWCVGTGSKWFFFSVPISFIVEFTFFVSSINLQFEGQEEAE